MDLNKDKYMLQEAASQKTIDEIIQYIKRLPNMNYVVDQIKSLSGTVNDMEGATEYEDGTRGLVPAPKAGNPNRYLSASGTWESVNTALTGNVVTARDARKPRYLYMSPKKDNDFDNNIKAINALDYDKNISFSYDTITDKTGIGYPVNVLTVAANAIYDDSYGDTSYAALRLTSNTNGNAIKSGILMMNKDGTDNPVFMPKYGGYLITEESLKNDKNLTISNALTIGNTPLEKLVVSDIIGTDILTNFKYTRAYETDVHPDDTKDLNITSATDRWYYVKYFPHRNHSGYGLQIAYPLNGLNNNERIRYRRSSNAAWGNWQTIACIDDINTEIANVKKEIPKSLPANGGNADTVDGMHGYQLQAVNESGTAYTGGKYIMTCKYNFLKDGRFYIGVSDNFDKKVAVNYAESSGSSKYLMSSKNKADGGATWTSDYFVYSEFNTQGDSRFYLAVKVDSTTDTNQAHREITVANALNANTTNGHTIVSASAMPSNTTKYANNTVFFIYS